MHGEDKNDHFSATGKSDLFNEPLLSLQNMIESHWPDIGHMITPVCKGSWEMKSYKCQ